MTQSTKALISFKFLAVVGSQPYQSTMFRNFSWIRNTQPPALTICRTGSGATMLSPALQLSPTFQLFSVPKQLKSANVLLLPKEFPLNSCSQLRPTSLTNIATRLFERIVQERKLAHLLSVAIDSDQFAYKTGHNSTMALIKCQHTWLKRLDEGSKFVNIFFRFQQSVWHC